MKNYFQLLFKLLNRKIIDFGCPLLIGYTLLPFLFVLSSLSLFEKTEYANYIYLALSLSFILKLGTNKRCTFLKSVFSNKRYRSIRIIENLICGIPFTLFLLYKKDFITIGVLQILAISSSFLKLGTFSSITIPTPFSKTPFEFPIGFRKTFYVLPIAYSLTYIAITVKNFNLGVFSMFIIGGICFSYYTKIEQEYFIWNFNLSPKTFLREKIKICFLFFTLLTSPIIITLSIFFINDISILISLFLLCYFYLATIILAKYASFSNTIEIPQVILIIISFTFPPLLLAVMPYFYSRSTQRLNLILK